MSYYRTTLPSDQVIPVEVARRLARENSYRTIPEVQAAIPPADCKDDHAWNADRRAMIDFLRSSALTDGMESRDVVPWCYRLDTDYGI